MAVYSWGFGKYGQLGNGQATSEELPQLMKLPKSSSPVQHSCGAHFTLVLCTVKQRDGSLKKSIFACGWGKNGRLGTGSENDCLLPTEVALSNEDIVQISAGFWHACCVTSDGGLFAWGYNRTHNVLGLIAGASKLSPFELVPTPVSLDGIRIKNVYCGYNYTYAIDIDGRCYSWGSNSHGVLGQGDANERTRPMLVDVPERASVVGCGYSHVALVTDNGKLYTAGNGQDGALGLSMKNDHHMLSLVTALDGLSIVHASCSLGERHGHTLACTKEGAVFSWGDGYKGKLGLGNQDSVSVPAKIDQKHFNDETVVTVACGGIHSTAVTAEGRVYSWGCGSDGRLGHPEAKGHRYLFRSDVPKRVESLPKAVKSVDCSYYHTVVLL